MTNCPRSEAGPDSEHLARQDHQGELGTGLALESDLSPMLALRLPRRDLVGIA